MQQVLKDRVLGRHEQRGQRLGVRRVARLDSLGLRQAELGEQHLLELLGRAEVELVPHHGVRRLLGRLHLGVQRRRHIREVVSISGDPGPLHLREHPDERQLDLLQQRARAPLAQVRVQRRG